MDIMKLGSELLKNKLGGGTVNAEALQSAFSSLLGGSDGKIDFNGLVEKLKSSDLAETVQSWLGDGDNHPISIEQIRELVGSEKLGQMASKLGCDENAILEGLKDAIPQMIDKASRGGKLLDSLGGLGGVADMAKKFF